MIKRNIPKKLVPVENLTEDLTLGSEGIDVTSPPTKQNTVYDMNNLDVSLDKGLSLRKPLFFKEHLNNQDSGVLSEYLFDDKRIEISESLQADVKFVNLDNSIDIKYVKRYVNIDDPTDIIEADRVRYTDVDYLYIEGYGNLTIVNDRGATISSSDIQIPNINNVQVVNTNTSSIILGVMFNLNTPNLKHYAKQYDLGKDFYKYRPIRITKDDSGVYKAEVLRIETSTLYTDESGATRAAFNLMDDYIYSFRDNYDAGYVYTNGIQVYTPSNTETDILSSTIEELTESNKFLIIDSVANNEVDKTYILKAFITNTVRDNANYKVYCTWEKTYDNVTWVPVKEFLDRFGNNTISLKITDSSVSYETLEKSYEYTRTVQYTPFPGVSATNQDTLDSRPDVLILDKADSATYRFSIRSVATTPPELGKKFNDEASYCTVISGISTLDNRDYITLNSETRTATINVKFHLEFNENVSGQLTNVFLTARSVYDPEESTSSYDYQASFTNLDNDSLDDLFGSYPIAWDYTNTKTTGEVTVPIPVTLATQWITQLLCLKFYLYEGSDTDNAEILWEGSIKAIAGYDISELSAYDGPVFNYYANEFRISENTTLHIVGGDSDHPECYKFEYNLITAINPDWVNSGATLPYFMYRPSDPYNEFLYMDRNNSLNLDLSLRIYEVKSKEKLPMEMLNNLIHSSGDGMYEFNNYAYYFKNVTLKCRLVVSTTIWAKYATGGFGIGAYEGFADLTVYLSDISISLYDYLNLKNDLSVLTTAITYTYNNIEISDSNPGPLTYSVDYRRGNSMSDSDYERVKNLFEAGPGFYPTDRAAWGTHYAAPYANRTLNGTVISKVYTKSPLLAAFTERVIIDVIDKLNNNVITANNIRKFNVAMPKNPYNTEVDMLNNDSRATLISTNVPVFWYDTAWNYGNQKDIIKLESPSLENLEQTPESSMIVEGTWPFSRYKNSTTYKPFKYLYNYDAVNNKNMFVRIASDLAIPNIYDVVKVKNSENVYNMLYDVLPADKYAPLGEVSTYLSVRYSLELANTTKNILFTKVKQIENYETVDIYNSNKTYYNYRIWYYGKSLKNNIYFSNGDSIDTPIDNCITLSTDTEDYVTSLTPWRDYLVATTTKNIYLISKYNDSYVFKQVNTFIGVPEQDSRTCKAILNGVIFKSGTQVYILHPNMYSSDDTILNIVDISKPISHLLVSGTSNFAIATEYYYYVFIPRANDTLVFKYEYIRKIWSKFTYPVVLIKAKLFNVGDILVTDAKNNIYYFDKTLDWYKDKLNVNFLTYGDYLDNTQTPTAIAFELDTGQKSSNMQYTKQFTESKFIIATMEMKDTFPIGVTIYVDGINLIASHKYISGNLQVITTDPNTDGAFSKTSPEDIGYLNTNVINDSGDNFNVIRQMILRYMGKGKTIRHVIKGESTFNFKIYVLYYRYRIPHNKQ